MEEQNKIDIAKQEMEIIAPSGNGETATPKSIDEIVANLHGFGLEELDDILTIQSKNKKIRLKITNIPTSDEMSSIQAADEFKGYLWVKRVKVEIISRTISWIDGIDLRKLPPDKRFVVDPTDPQKSVRDIQVVLRNLIMSWGQEIMEILWKVVMTHAQNIEDRFKSQFPANAVMTEVEQRLFEQAKKQIAETNRAIIDKTVSELYEMTDTDEDDKT